MRRHRVIVCLFFSLLLPWFARAAEPINNVFFIVSDDLRASPAAEQPQNRPNPFR